MELTQLKYFLSVYEKRNIYAAAQQMNVSQQAVSKQLQKLEDELSVRLFTRNTRGVVPTLYADLLAEKLQRFLPELESLTADFQQRGAEVSGVVRLGVQCWQMSARHGLRYGALHDFERAYPRVHLRWENSIPKRCAQGIRDGELDLAVCVLPEDPSEFDLTELCRAHWYMLMSREHPLAAREVLTVDDLAGQRVILANNEKASRARFNRQLAGKTLPIYIDVGDFIFDLIGQQIEGENAMMLTTEAVREQFNPDRYAMIPLSTIFGSDRLYLMRAVKTRYAPAEETLHQFLLENWSD